MAKFESTTFHIAGISLLMLLPGMFVSLLIEWAAHDQYSNNEWALVTSMVITAGVGALLWRGTRAADRVRPSSVYSAVAFTWILCSLAGALPYAFGSMFDWAHFDDAIFESASGYSATGSTVLSDIEANGRGILMWRQFTQWYGGMGMVVLAVTVLPALGVGGLSLMSAEAPGPDADRLAPRVSDTARQLWTMYLGVTAALTLALWIAPGPTLYDAFGHAMTTAATGGYSTYNASIGHYDSVLIESILVVGMLFCALNFNLHYRAIKGDFSGYRNSSDTHWFFGIVGGAIIACTLLNWMFGLGGFGTILRNSIFNVVTLASSTGFGNATGEASLGNFVIWAPSAQIILLCLMVVGGSVGSTAGGVKVFRFEVAMSHMVRQLQLAKNPRRVMAVKIGREPIADEVVGRVLAFMGLFFAILLVGTLAITALGGEFVTSASAAISAMSNMGPALGEAGPTANFAQAFTRPARMVLVVLMITGRLEIFAVLLMFASLRRRLRLRR